MKNNVPFTAYLRIVPNRASGKRFEIRRSLEKISQEIYESLMDVDRINLAISGSSGTNTSKAIDGDSLSNMSMINAIRPQFGQFYNMVTIVGFINDNAFDDNNVHRNEPPYSDMTVINANEITKIPASGARGWNKDTMPTQSAIKLVKELKTILDNAIEDIEGASVRKIDINGVVWGEGRYHFPR